MKKKLLEQFLNKKSDKTNNTCPLDYEIIYKKSSDKIFNIKYTTEPSIINDYCLSENYNEKEVICHIDKLREYLKDIIEHVIDKHLYKENRSSLFTDCDKEMVINQIIMDILFDKFLNEQDFIYRANYSDYMAEILTELYGKTVDPNAVRNALGRQMTNFAEKLEQKKQKQLLLLGIDPIKFIDYQKDFKIGSPFQKRTKLEWDHAFYNSHLITKLQYRRKKLKDTSTSKNYSYNQKEEDIRTFYQFEDLLLSPKRKVYSNWQKDENVFDCKDESAKDYYIKSMEYYYLEGYKRVDFMLQYAKIIGDSDISLNNLKMLDHSIVNACCPEIDENNRFAVNKSKKKFYRPMILIDRDIIDREFVKKIIKRDSGYMNSWIKLLIRARTYELFKFHAKYISSDYEDIRNFLDTSYNLRNFHNSVNIEAFLSDSEMKQNIKNFYVLNNYLFPDDSKISSNDFVSCLNDPNAIIRIATEEELKKQGLLHD